jgi:subtilisin
MKRLFFAFTILSLLAIVFSSSPVGATPAEKVDVLIGFNQPPGQAEQALVRSLGGDVRYTYSIIPTIAATIPENAIAGLRHNPRVTHVNPSGWREQGHWS